MQLTRVFEDSLTNYFWIRLGIYITIIGLFVMDIFHVFANWGIILITIVAVIECFQQKPRFKSFIESTYFTPFLIIFAILCISLLFTERKNLPDIGHYFEKRLMFLALPFSFIVMPGFPKRIYVEAFWLFFILALFTSIGSTINFYLHKKEIVESYSYSNILPTPVHHVRYSLMICYAIFLGMYILSQNQFKQFQLVIKPFLSISILFLIFFLHLLAVRSGLLAFYFIAILGIIYFLIKKNYTYLLALVASIILLIYFSLQHLETVQAKIGNTLYDLYQSSNEESYNNYSLTRRMVSNKVAFTIFKENPWLGAGEGNLESKINNIYQLNYPSVRPENYISPHNQFLTILASLGIIGFLIFFTSFYYPLLYKKNYRFLPLLTIYLILTISFVSEDTLQTQLGYMFGLFFIMFNLHFLKTNSKTSETFGSHNYL